MLAKVYSESYAQALAPEPDLTVSAWADKHRILDQASSSEPGMWRTKRTPFLKEIMDCLSATSKEDVIVFQKGAQIGATEAGLNWLLYVIHHAPSSFLYVLPTAETAKRVSKQRLAPAIELIPEVSSRVSVPRARDSGNTISQKDFKGGTLILSGSNSGVGLRSIPARNLFLDEVDAYPSDVDQEGSPITLAMRRTATFKRNRKIFITSTPTLKGLSIIEDYYSQSDQRRYFVPCPDCDHYQVIEWKSIVWKDNDPTTAHMVCEECGVIIPETKKTQLLERGEWRPTAKGRYTGFHLSSLYSPSGWYGWVDAATDFLAAKKSGLEQMKTFVNTVLGQTWEEEQGESIDPSSLIARREEYGELPFDVRVIGADVQKDRIELEHIGYSKDEESWGLDYIILPGDTTQAEVWDDLTAVVEELAPDAVAIDSGYNTQFVYDWVQGRRYAYATKGIAGEGIPLIEDVQKRARRLRTRRRRGFAAEPVGVDQGKAIIYSRLGMAEPGPGYMHFPINLAYDSEYFAQLTSEKLVTRYFKGRPRREWVQSRPRNEVIDIRVLGLVAFRLCAGRRRKRAPLIQPEAPKPAPRNRAKAPEGTPWL